MWATEGLQTTRRKWRQNVEIVLNVFHLLSRKCRGWTVSIVWCTVRTFFLSIQFASVLLCKIYYVLHCIISIQATATIPMYTLHSMVDTDMYVYVLQCTFCYICTVCIYYILTSTSFSFQWLYRVSCGPKFSSSIPLSVEQPKCLRASRCKDWQTNHGDFCMHTQFTSTWQQGTVVQAIEVRCLHVLYC